MRWIRAGIVAAFLLAAVAAALAGGTARPEGESSEAPSGTSAPPELSATAELRRSFIESGGVAIAVTNHGRAPVRVLSVELLSDSFAPLGPQEFDTAIPPGEVPKDLQIQYGGARCPDGIASTAAASSVRLSVETDDGVQHETTLALPHPNGTLDRLLREACAARLVAESLSIELARLDRAEDGTLTGTLSLGPADGVSASATEVRGSVLFEITASDLTGDTFDLAFDAHRCGGHAVGDAKQPFAFTVFVAIDGGDPVAAPIPVSAEHERDLYAMLDERCGHSGD